jgi:hypothetical protein
MIVNGTTYHDRTDERVIAALEWARARRVRIRVHYGTTVTSMPASLGSPVGSDWGDTYHVEGYVGRSTGNEKIPLLVNNARSTGGPAILDDCIVRVRMANRSEGGDIYRHPSYCPPPRGDFDEKTYNRHFA